MKTTRTLHAIFLLSLFAGLMMSGRQVWAQGKKPVPGTTPGPPVTKTKLEVKGSCGPDCDQWVKALTIESANKITFRYSTDQPGATSAIWQVSDKPFSSGPQTTVVQAAHVIASGALGQVPTPGHIDQFDINFALFAPNTPPASPQGYWVFIVTKNSQQQTVGLASGPVKITYRKSTQGPVNFGANAVFPSVEFVTYVEKIGMVPLTQLHFAGADVKLRISNNGKTATDPIGVSVTDSSLLMRQNSPQVSVPSLKPSASQLVSVHLDAILPPPTSQLPEDKQYSQWNQEYKDRCGVDLRVDMDWRGPQAQAPMNGHSETDLYQGYGTSRSWQEGRPLSDTVICDDKNCVSINRVARSIYKQLGCKVVGYAFFVGDKLSGPRSRFDAFGKARTSLNPPETDFAPTTKMQIASTSKVLTALTGMRVFGNKLGNMAFNSFPSNWTLPQPPQSTIVKNITFREFLSHTSGVQQYYASASGQDFNSLQTFFTQTLPNPNAPRSCPGPCTPSPSVRLSPKQKTCGPRVIPNPIVMQKTPFCYTNTNFGIMRLLLPRFAGANTNDPTQLAQQYVQQVRDNVFTPVGVQNVACKPPATPSGYALLYKYPGNQISGDWGDLTNVSGDWGWYVSVEDYAKVLVSLNSADHKILTDCQLNDMEMNPSAHPVGWDIRTDGAGHRWLEKNGADGTGNGALQTTSVGIFGGRSGCGGTSPIPGVAGALFINSDVANQPNTAAWTVLLKAFQDATKPKP